MIKDKKIIERGKYVVYNSGIRRPPHTGASILALRSEFYREKLRSFHKNRQEEDIRAYCEYFEIDSEEALDEILKLETQIQPVNVSYFPVRAKKNILNKLADLSDWFAI